MVANKGLHYTGMSLRRVEKNYTQTF